MELAIKRSSSPAADAPFQVEIVVGACMAVRGLALGLINKGNAKRILAKELGIALLNGSVSTCWSPRWPAISRRH